MTARNRRSTQTLPGTPARPDNTPLLGPLEDEVDTAQTSAAAAQADIDAHEARTDNPHATTKAQVGLANVANLDQTNAVNKAHDRQHAIDAGADHTGVAGATADNLVAFNGSGLPKDSSISSSSVSTTVSKVAAGAGVSGSFTTVDGKTITVVDGVITAIV